MSRVAPTDAGMSLVEVIIALAIASTLALALGGLLTFSIEAKNRVDRASRIEASLLELKVAAGIFDQLVPIDSGFRVTGERTNLALTFRTTSEVPNVVMTVSLTPPAAKNAAVSELRFEDPLGRIIGPVALGPFDNARLEFLSSGADRLAWLAYPEAADQLLLGMRIVVSGEGRQWPVLLWAARLLAPA